MAEIKYYDPDNRPGSQKTQEIIQFLYKNLEEYGDPEDQITAAVDYALQNMDSDGGCILTISSDDTLRGVTVINKTGMTGYIPENILVYIATDANSRGKGYGRNLMEAAIEQVEGDIALHVEKENPARFLYEKLGFTSPYLEMRLKK